MAVQTLSSGVWNEFEGVSMQSFWTSALKVEQSMRARTVNERGSQHNRNNDRNGKWPG